MGRVLWDTFFGEGGSGGMGADATGQVNGCPDYEAVKFYFKGLGWDLGHVKGPCDGAFTTSTRCGNGSCLLYDHPSSLQDLSHGFP